VVVAQDIYIPRIHVASIETCGCVAKFDKKSGKLTVWMTTQAPHAIRTVFSLVSKTPEHKIRVISPDIGGGFGGKVPVYPRYVCAIVAALTTGRPVKWIEDRSENLQADSFARDYHMHAELAADSSGKMQGLRIKTIADHGAADAGTAMANPAAPKPDTWLVIASMGDGDELTAETALKSGLGYVALVASRRRACWIICASAG
jgi:carbon-monoxide dehydrogenase large subunit